MTISGDQRQMEGDQDPGARATRTAQPIVTAAMRQTDPTRTPPGLAMPRSQPDLQSGDRQERERLGGDQAAEVQRSRADERRGRAARGSAPEGERDPPGGGEAVKGGHRDQGQEQRRAPQPAP